MDNPIMIAMHNLAGLPAPQEYHKEGAKFDMSGPSLDDMIAGTNLASTDETSLLSESDDNSTSNDTAANFTGEEANTANLSDEESNTSNLSDETTGNQVNDDTANLATNQAQDSQNEQANDVIGMNSALNTEDKEMITQFMKEANTEMRLVGEDQIAMNQIMSLFSLPKSR